MAEPQEPKTLSLSEQYALKDKDEKVEAEVKPAEAKEVEAPAATGDPEEVIVAEKAEEQPAESTENSSPAAAVEESTESSTEEADPPAPETAAAEESSDNAEENPPATEAEEEPEQEAPEVKLETAPADFRFPTTNQTRHCFTRYVEYHRCVAAKGEGAPECDRFQKYYRALCPGEWVERWNEQRENGTFPGPL